MITKKKHAEALFKLAFLAGLEKVAKEKGEKLESGEFAGGKEQPSSDAPAGEGGRFKALVGKLKGKKGVKDPEALAAAIGRAKFKKKNFQAMAAKGK